MTQLEFRRLRGELWDQSFISKLGKTATKLYKAVYGKAPRLIYSGIANRDRVHRYPCGILEQAYAQLMVEGVPLMKPGSNLDQRIQRGERLGPPTQKELEQQLLPQALRRLV
jgi:hypothetical protein